MSESDVPATEYDDAFDATVNLARAGFAIAHALSDIARQIDRLGLNGAGAPEGALAYVEHAIREGADNIAGQISEALGTIDLGRDDPPAR